ncbi:hypothetical protein [Sulfurovum riftiae]|uniref:hypothetical protein n=1 Tax=Sulfurovum riftiae TaxID=1630136 RepID=UPI000ABCAFA1|nr:hypothetical protein [Sulfurovum riftiae]
MGTEQLQTTIIWLKRILGVTAIAIWVYVMATFLKDPAPFSELAPYCMGSTMLIFGILTAVFKGLEFWETQIKEKRESNEEKKR